MINRQSEVSGFSFLAASLVDAYHRVVINWASLFTNYRMVKKLLYKLV